MSLKYKPYTLVRAILKSFVNIQLLQVNHTQMKEFKKLCGWEKEPLKCVKLFK